jgi:flagellar motor protein MotB
MDVNIDHLRFSIQEDYLFKPGTTEFAPTAEKYLGKVGDILKGFKGYVQINGHVDSSTVRGPAGAGSAYEFATTQAVAVMKYFVAERLVTEDRVSPRGMGPESQYSDSDSPDARARNNRIEFVLTRKKAL